MSSGVRLSGNYIVESVNAIKIPAGTDAQRPNSPSQGEMRFNTTGNALEIYNGGSWTVPTGGGGSTTTSTITGATQANPVIITTASAHNLIDSSYVNITGVVGMTELNGNNYYVDVLSSDSFALYSDSGLTAGVDGSGFTLYVSGGLVVSGSTSPGFLSLTDTPSTYSGAGKYLKVNPSNNGIEFDSLTTDDIIEGTNKFFNGKTTDDLPEGTGNLYLSTSNLNTFGIDSLSDVKTTGSGHVPTDGQALVWDLANLKFVPGTVGGGGASDFVGLSDTPANFTGGADKFVKVNSAANALEFVADPGYLTSVPAQSFASLTGKPTTIAGYGITDAFDGAFGSLSGTPTTLSGYGITDALASTSTGNVTLDVNGAGLGISIGNASTSGSTVSIGAEVNNTSVNMNGVTEFNARAIFSRGTHEIFYTFNGQGGVTDHNVMLGHLFYHTGVTGDLTPNFTNFDLTAEDATNITIIIQQGNTAYEIPAIQIGGAAQTIVWQNNSAPTGTANGTDSFSFTILNDGGTYVVLGQMVSFGGV